MLISVMVAIFILILMIASDYSAFTTEMAIPKANDEVFDKSFSPMWGSFIIPLCIIVIAFISKPKK